MLKLVNVSKYYRSETSVSLGMRKVSIEFDLGEFVAITGESGAGKSTLLNVISGLDGYEEGEMYFNDLPTSHYTVDDFELYRAKYIGFIFQNYNIIDSYSVLQNILLALEIQGYQGNKRERALELINKVGLSHRIHHKASKLSGGEKQRTVIARALAKDCPVIVADEPTGNLDSKSGEQIMKLLHEISKDKLIIVVTHNYEEVKPYVTRTVKMHDGTIVEDKKNITKEKEDAKIEIENPKNMSFPDVLRFALRNILVTPRRTVFTLTMFILAIGAIILSYGGAKSMIDDIQGVSGRWVLDILPETRMIVTRRDNGIITDDDYNYISGIVTEKNLHKHDDYAPCTSVYYYESSYMNMLLAQKTHYAKHLDVNNDLSEIIDNRKEILHDKPEIYISDDIDLEIGKTITLILTDFLGRSMEERFAVAGKVKGKTKSTVYFNDYVFKITMPRIYESLPSSYTAEVEAYEKNYINLRSGGLYAEPEKGKIYYGSSYLDDTISKMRVSYLSFYIEKEYMFEYNDLYGYWDFFTMNSEDYSEMISSLLSEIYGGRDVNGFDPDYRQLSVNVENKAHGIRVLNRINNQEYRVFYPENASDITADFQKIMLGMLFFVVIGLEAMILFFVLSLVTKNIMKSRKKDFAIYRSIGATRRSLSNLVIFEEFMFGTIGFIISLIIFMILELTVVPGMIFENIGGPGIIIVYLVIVIFSIRLGFKFNRKIFDYTVIQTLSGEGVDYL